MWDSEVQTIRDLIYFRLARISCNTSSNISSSNSNKLTDDIYFKELFNEIRKSRNYCPVLTKEETEFNNVDVKCIYCGSATDVSPGHIVPKTLKLLRKCGSCNKIRGRHNLVWVCSECNKSKGLKGLYEFYKTKYANVGNYIDFIPPLIEKKYLTTIFCCYQCMGTLDSYIKDNNNEIDFVLLDSILQLL